MHAMVLSMQLAECKESALQQAVAWTPRNWIASLTDQLFFHTQAIDLPHATAASSTSSVAHPAQCVTVQPDQAHLLLGTPRLRC